MKDAIRGKLLFVDLVSPPAHLDVDYFFIRHVFPYVGDYCYMVERGFYQKMISQYRFSESPSTVFFPLPAHAAPGRLSAHAGEFKKTGYVLDYMKRNNIDSVYFLSYHTLSLSYYANAFRNHKVILMNHDNISRFMRNPVRRYVLRRLKQFTHAVYSCSDDPRDAQGLYGSLRLKKLVTIEHNIDETRTIRPKTFAPDAVSLYAPSNGNDNGKILDCLESLRSGNVALRAKVNQRMYLRHRTRFGKELFSGFIGPEEFDREMNAADFVLVLYPDDYRFRTSGLIFDAIAYEKPVVTDNRFLYEAYLKKNGLGILVDGPRAVERTASGIDRPAYELLVENMRRYKRSYSAERIGRDFAAKLQEIVRR